MTREEAIKRLRQNGGPDDYDPLNAVCDLFERAGLIKFDEPRSILVEKLVHCMVEIDRDTDRHSCAGRLTPYGAGCIVEFIEQLGFKIVEASE